MCIRDRLKKSELVSLFLLVQHPGGEIDGLDVGTQFTHDGTTEADLFGRVREADFPRSCFRGGHDGSSLARR